MSNLRVLVLAGGISHERDVSLKSGRRVADALTDAGISTEIREPDGELVGHLMALGQMWFGPPSTELSAKTALYRIYCNWPESHL